MKGMSLEITEELIARQPLEAQAIIRALLARIQQLQDQLNQSPRNSSVPPSTEHPHAKPPRPKSQAARRRGGQPGHTRYVRPLLPSGQCDECGLHEKVATFSAIISTHFSPPEGQDFGE